MRLERDESMSSIDVPSDGEVVSRGTLVVSGWAVRSGKRAVVAVFVAAVDANHSAAVRAQSYERKDVAEELGLGSSGRFGWAAELDLSSFDGPIVSIHVAIWPRMADPPAVLPPISVFLEDELGPIDSTTSGGVTAPLIGALDEPRPADGPLERDILSIRGCAMTPVGLVERVDLFVNRENVGRARLGNYRFDLLDRYKFPHTVLSGFDHYIDLAKLPKATSVLCIEAVASINGHSSSIGKAEVLLKPAKKGLRVTNDVRRDLRREQTLKKRTNALLESLGSSHEGSELNLLVVTHELGYGGGQLWLSELLNKSGAGSAFPCTVISAMGGALVPYLEQRGIEVRITEGFAFRNIDIYESQVLEIALLSRTLGHNCALVNTLGAAVGADAALRLGIPCVWAIHESWPPDEFWRIGFPRQYVDPLVQRAAMRTLASVPALVFEADATRQLFEAFAKPGATRVIPYGIDLDAIDVYKSRISEDAARHGLGISHDERVVLAVGTIEPRKNQSVIATAFAQVLDRHPKAVLVLVGDSGGQYSEALKYYVKAAGLTSRIRIERVTHDVFRWYRAADLFISASDVESLPRSILEVMAFGVPVLSSSVFGVPEVIKDGVNGFLFPARDGHAVAACLDVVLGMSRDSLLPIAEAGERLVRSQYDSRQHAATIAALLQEFVEQANSR